MCAHRTTYSRDLYSHVISDKSSLISVCWLVLTISCKICPPTVIFGWCTPQTYEFEHIDGGAVKIKPLATMNIARKRCRTADGLTHLYVLASRVSSPSAIGMRRRSRAPRMKSVQASISTGCRYYMPFVRKFRTFVCLSAARTRSSFSTDFLPSSIPVFKK